MAAWTVWALLGLYPLAGTPWYALAAPAFANVSAGGLRVLARNASALPPLPGVEYSAEEMRQAREYLRAVNPHPSNADLVAECLRARTGGPR